MDSSFSIFKVFHETESPLFGAQTQGFMYPPPCASTNLIPSYHRSEQNSSISLSCYIDTSNFSFISVYAYIHQK